MWIIGHRGAAGTHPENTLLSIEHALHCGVDWIEIDIRFVDGNLIVLHDERLDRTTNGSGSVYDWHLQDLRRLDAGRGEKIPLLHEVIDLIDGRAGLNIEIKQAGLTKPLTDLLAAYLRRGPAWRDKFMLSSFLQEPMRELRDTAPAGCLLAALSDHEAAAATRFALEIGAFSLNVSRAELNPSIVERAHRHGLRVLVYTVNAVSDVKQCFELSVDGIFTDYPGRAIAFLRD